MHEPTAVIWCKQTPRAFTTLFMLAAMVQHLSFAEQASFCIIGLWIGAAPVQVLLTMSRQQKHEQTVLQLLKKRVTQACEEESAGGSSGRSSSSASIRGGCSGWMSGLQQVNKCPTIKDMQDGLMKAIRYMPQLVVKVAKWEALLPGQCAASRVVHVCWY